MVWFDNYGNHVGYILNFCYQVLKAGNIPQHVAFIMDGNRRYARKEKVKTKVGHGKGFDKLTEVLHWCHQLAIPEVTVYAFSIENFKRSEEEVDALLSIFKEKIEKLLEERDSLEKYGVCVRFVGNIMLFDEELRKLMSKVVAMTKGNTQSVLNIAVAYTSRDEITQSIKEVAIGVQKGMIKESDISESLLEKCFYTNKSRPVDLLIRTSGEIRLSDFLLWQSSYAILCFIEPLWPDLSIWEFFLCILKYQVGYQDVEAAKEYSTLKEIRSQMNSDMHQVAEEMKSKINHNDRNSRTVSNKIIEEFAKEREERISTFLEYVNNQRENLFFPYE